jgi:hypothetical protein
MCETCQSDKKNIWPALIGHPKLLKEKVHPENYLFVLVRCPKCNQLWCDYYYEPFSSYPYLVKWQKTVNEFESISIEKIAIWHSYAVNYEFSKLPSKEKDKALVGGMIPGCIERYNDLSKDPDSYLS